MCVYGSKKGRTRTYISWYQLWLKSQILLNTKIICVGQFFSVQDSNTFCFCNGEHCHLFFCIITRSPKSCIYSRINSSCWKIKGKCCINFPASFLASIFNADAAAAALLWKENVKDKVIARMICVMQACWQN